MFLNWELEFSDSDTVIQWDIDSMSYINPKYSRARCWDVVSTADRGAGSVST